MQPTPFALELQGPIAGVLATVRGSIIGRKANNPEQSERHFKIIASDYIIQVLLRHVLADIAKSAPSVTFEFLSPFAHEVNVLAKGGADIMMAPESVMLDTYKHVPLVSDELVCIADINNKLVDKELTMEEFSSLGHISVGFARASHLSIEQWLVQTMETNRRVEVITNDFSTMIHTLLNTDRIAILPRHFAQMHIQREGIKIIKLPFETPKLKENMMWHPTLENDPMHTWLRANILKHAERYI